MKKNGFTLIELLAVIVLLALIIVIAVPNITKTSQKMQTNMYCTKVKNIEKAAQLYGNDNYDTIDNSSASGYKYSGGNKTSENFQHAKKVKIRELVQKNYQKKDDNKTNEVLDPRDDTSMLDKEVLVFIKSGRVYASYQFDEFEDYDACKE